MTEKAYVLIALIVVLAALAYSYTIQNQPQPTNTQDSQGNDTKVEDAMIGETASTSGSTAKTESYTVTIGEEVRISGTWIRVDGITLTIGNDTIEASISLVLPNMCWNAKQGNASINDGKLQITVQLEKKGDICAQALKQQLLTYTLQHTATKPTIAEITLVYQDETGATTSKTIQVQLQE